MQILAAPINDLDKFARSDCTWQRVLPAGIVLPYGGSPAPPGFLLCDGTSYPTATYPNLFAVLQYTYGGSGANFNVPDMRGRTAVGAGTGTGLTNRVLGGKLGEETHQLTIAELASHTHVQNAHNHLYGFQNFAAGTGGATQPGTNVSNTNAATTSTTAVNQNTGSDTAPNNMQPSLFLSYIVKT